MKLKTSFFKPVVLKKDILRFAPVWALYLIGMMLILLETGYYADYDRFAYNRMADFIPSFAVVNIVYAAICANLLFGDLYNTKLCYSLHAMPYRRESWLVTHLVSGLSFSFVPNCVAALYMMTRLDAYWYMALCWLLATTLQFIFFYGLATVSAMLTGNRFAMLAVYAGFNFVSLLLYATINAIYLPMVTGVVVNMRAFSRFSPVVELFNFDYFQFTRKEVLVPDTAKPGNEYMTIFYQLDGLSDGWGYLAILAVVGLAAMGVAVWLYRQRHLESAGDFVAFPKLKGMACAIITLCVALCFALMGDAVGSGYILWMAVGLVIGFFGSLMLLERRIKVFRKGTLLGFAVMVVAVILSMVSIRCDWFGIESWTPKVDHVQSVTITNTTPNAYDYYDPYYSNNIKVVLENPTDIDRIITAHEDILTRLDMPTHNITTHRVTLTYTMKSGRTVVRSYRVPATGEGYQIISRYLYQMENVLGYQDAAKTAPKVQYMYCEDGPVPPELYEKMLAALMTDCTNGRVLPNSSAAPYYIEYAFQDENGVMVYRHLDVLGGAENYVALIKSTEMIMGYGDWDKFPQQIRFINFSGGPLDGTVPEAYWEDLLKAIRADIEAGNIPSENSEGGSFAVYYEVRASNGDWLNREFFIGSSAKYTIHFLGQFVDEEVDWN